jgi:hypothetical protein
MHGGLIEADDTRLTQALDMARRTVRLDGIAEGNEEFSTLQLLFASVILESQGLIGGPISSHSVADVSVSYRSGQAGGTWEERYRSHRLKVCGIQGRFA